jgi:hypothetical protein
MSVTEYCNQAVHDQELCDQYGNLEYKDWNVKPAIMTEYQLNNFSIRTILKWLS